MSYKDYIKEVKDFPIEGVNFKDISPLLADQETFRSALEIWVDILTMTYLIIG